MKTSVWGKKKAAALHKYVHINDRHVREENVIVNFDRFVPQISVGGLRCAQNVALSLFRARVHVEGVIQSFIVCVRHTHKIMQSHQQTVDGSWCE